MRAKLADRSAQCKAPVGLVLKEGKVKQRHIVWSKALRFEEDDEEKVGFTFPVRLPGPASVR